MSRYQYTDADEGLVVVRATAKAQPDGRDLHTDRPLTSPTVVPVKGLKPKPKKRKKGKR